MDGIAGRHNALNVFLKKNESSRLIAGKYATAKNESCSVRGWIARVPISVRWYDPLRFSVVSYRKRSDASHDKNREI